ncbi:DMT family transporter [Alicyclobacillus acidiphilus]|uniref:DMT family transporter n=1 Tax=Alicyclobacillus acidiphilus TaxID=182455 RepID=UPI001FDEC8F5|nr:DMT family transporter [Alicyclobacillus acidiphilus]
MNRLAPEQSAASKPLQMLFLMIGLAAVSFSAIFIEWSTAPAPIIGMYRLWMSVCVFLPAAWRAKGQLKDMTRRDFSLVLLSGLFLGLHFLFWIQSLKETSVASSMIIISLEPIFVLIGAFFLFREHIRLHGLVSMIIAMLGVVLVASGDFGRGREHVYGDVLSLIGTLAVSVYMLAGQQVRKRVSSSLYNVLVFFVAGFVLFLYSLATAKPLLHYTGQNWLMFALLAVVSTVLGHGIFNWLLDRVRATTVAMTILGEPVVAIVFAMLLLNQPINLLQGIGGLVCLLSVYWFLRYSANKSDDKTYPPSQETQSA